MKKILEFCYTRDQNGDLYLTDAKPGHLYKDNTSWRSLGNGRWFEVGRTTHRVIKDAILLDSLDLSDIPEPQWEDEKPIIITVNLDISLNYYIEDEDSSNQ